MFYIPGFLLIFLNKLWSNLFWWILQIFQHFGVQAIILLTLQAFCNFMQPLSFCVRMWFLCFSTIPVYLVESCFSKLQQNCEDQFVCNIVHPTILKRVLYCASSWEWDLNLLSLFYRIRALRYVICTVYIDLLGISLLPSQSTSLLNKDS